MTEQDKSKPTKKIIYGCGDVSLVVDSEDKQLPFTLSSIANEGTIYLTIEEASWLHRVLGEALALSKEN